MTSDRLALHGGTPVIKGHLRPFATLDRRSRRRANQVLRSGVLSQFLGARSAAFRGGPEVRTCEKDLASTFAGTHAATFNSWTSGLEAAIAALGVAPGDEVITTPWTMSACLTAILHSGGIPVFADVDRETFNIDPAQVEAAVTPRTVGILSADIFGLPGEYRELRRIASQRGLFWIVDAAQAPGAQYEGAPSGSWADIWGYSFNYHKHLQCGEGGVALTNSERLAERLWRIRNHGENVMSLDDDVDDLANIIGHNYRLGEIEAAIISGQLSALPRRVESRRRAAAHLISLVSRLPGVSIAQVPPNRSHAYYVLGLDVDCTVTGVNRDTLVDALRAEGIPNVMAGYQNLHRLPAVERRVAMGASGFPWSLATRTPAGVEARVHCPVAEELHDRSFVGLLMCSHQLDSGDCEQIGSAFAKVWNNLDALRLAGAVGPRVRA